MSQAYLFEDLETFSVIWPRSATMRNGRNFQRRQLVPRTSVIEYSLWPMLRAQEKGGYQYDKGNRRSKRLTLLGVARLYPTLTATDKGGGRINRSRSPNAAQRPSLARMGHMGLLPTLTTGDARQRKTSRKAKELYSAGPSLTEYVHSSGQSGPLNPTWCEWFMGFPIGWTELKDSETP
jgi:hypothetical protein